MFMSSWVFKNILQVRNKNMKIYFYDLTSLFLLGTFAELLVERAGY
jgi:hypothetical protein